jgi:hypothetical protein
MNRLALIASILLAPTLALAHDGPRIWLGQESGRVTTYTSNDDFDPVEYHPERVFFADFDQFGDGIFATDFPGFESKRSGNTLPSPTTFAFDLAGPLLRLDAVTGRMKPTDEFATAPNAKLAVSSAADGIISGTGVVPGFTHFTFVTVGNHEHLFFTLLGDGSTVSDAPEGVYGLPMILRSPTLARSEWIIVLFNKSSATGQLAAAYADSRVKVESNAGDADFDGAVDFADLLTLAQNYGAASGKWWADGDFDFDGSVGFSDLLALAQNYQADNLSEKWAHARALVPEPTALVLLGGGVLMLRRSSKRQV